MSLNDCIKFANENPVCFLATADGNQPRVRGFLLWYADENGFYFHTGAPKDVCKQLKKNPKIEVCFYAPKDGGKMMRVAGEVEFLHDKALEARLLDERPFLKQIRGDAFDASLLAIFKIHKGEAHLWTLKDNMRESAIERVKF